MALLERIVSAPSNVFMAATREDAVQAVINGAGTNPVPVSRYFAWPALQRYMNDNGIFDTFNPASQDPVFIWDNSPQDAEFLGFAVSSSVLNVSNSTQFDISIVAFADNAHSMQIDLVNADTNTIVPTVPLGILLNDGSMVPASGVTTDTSPFNWQNIRFYSISTEVIPAGNYKIIVSFTALNYDQFPGFPNPAGLAFVADIFAPLNSVTILPVFNETQGIFYPTINAAVAAANNNDTILVLPGTLEQSSQVNINKPILLRGLPGSQIVLTAPVIPFLLSGNDITLDNLTITSNNPYGVEFIQVAGDNNIIMNNLIFGPPQALPMSGWVVNRAVVTQGGANNLLVQGNTFHFLRTGMYLNPGSTGTIMNNVVFNTKGGFLVDNASFTISGNSWGNPPNEFDIVLFVSVSCNNPLYDPIATLSANNSNATISDQRVCP